MTFKTTPYDHQLRAYEKLKNEKYFALFMEMGLGKSKVAIDIAVHKYEKGQIETVLVIAPNNVHQQWADEQIPLHCSIPYRVFVWHASKMKRRNYQAKFEEFMLDDRKLRFFMINVETFQSNSVVKYVAEYVKNFETFIIVDESTRIKTPKAKRTKTITKLNKYGQRCILSGTPVTKSPFDLYAPFNFLKDDFFGVNFFIFKHRYGVMMRGVNPHTGGRFHKLIDEKTFSIVKSRIAKLLDERKLSTMNMDYKLTPDDYEMLAAVTSVSEKNIKFIEKRDSYTRYKRLDELKAAIEPFTFAAKKKDCLDLPEKIYTVEYVQMSDEQKKVYNELKKHLLAEYDNKELSVMNKVSLTMRLRQITGGYFPYKTEAFIIDGSERIPYMKNVSTQIGKSNVKIERLREIIEETAGESIIIWASFVAELEAIYSELKKDYHCELYYGRTPKQKRQEIKEDFMKGKVQILIANPSTAGYGLNLQISTLQLWFSNSYRTEDRLQAEDRSHRIGTKTNVIYKDIICKGTIDEKVYKAIKEGRDLNDYFSQTSLREILQDDEEE